MQSATPISQAEYDHGMIVAGKWCYNYGNAEAQDHYSKLYGIYLTNGGIATMTREVSPTLRGRRVAAVNANTQTKAVTTTKAAAPTRRQRSTTGTTTGLDPTRTTTGTVGPQDGKVLAKVVAAPGGITTEALRKNFARNPTLNPTLQRANILGTAIGRLLKAGYMTGPEKVGPFLATETGIAAVKMQPTSINAPRNRRKAAQPAMPEVAQPQAQAG